MSASGNEPKHFFFYGTLQAENLSEQARQIQPKLRRVDEASVRGRLFAIRAPHLSYPALILDVDLQARVHGNCYEMRDSFADADLRYLDTYEEFFPDAPSKSEYLREALEINLKSGDRLTAWCYVYNLPLPRAAEPIPSGDFRDYRQR